MIPKRKRRLATGAQNTKSVDVKTLDPNGGAVQFFNRPSMKKATQTSSRRWRSPNCTDFACLANTKGEARIQFALYLGIEKLPVGFVIERF